MATTYCKIHILRPPLGLSKSGLKEHSLIYFKPLPIAHFVETERPLYVECHVSFSLDTFSLSLSAQMMLSYEVMNHQFNLMKKLYVFQNVIFFLSIYMRVKTVFPSVSTAIIFLFFFKGPLWGLPKKRSSRPFRIVTKVVLVYISLTDYYLAGLFCTCTDSTRRFRGFTIRVGTLQTEMIPSCSLKTTKT